MSDTLKSFPARLHKMTRMSYREVPSLVVTRRFVDELTALFFPVRDIALSERAMERRWDKLQEDFLNIIGPLCPDLKESCQEVTERFFSELPLIYTRLLQDATLYKTCDPAACCIEEVTLCYPGFYAVMVHRIAHAIHTLQVPILPRVISEYAHSQTGIDIHPAAEIGSGFYIDHGTGIVIGETTVIGKNVTIYQGVTLGAKFVDKELKGVRRHPTIEDNVVIYAGSTILGGETVIGHDTVIGGNVWLTESVPPHSTVYHRPEIIIKDKNR